MADTPDTLAATPGFMDKVYAGDGPANASWEAAHRAAVGAAPAPVASGGQAAITAAMADGAFMDLVYSGDGPANEKWNALHQGAHPEPAPDPINPTGYIYTQPEGLPPDHDLQRYASEAFASLGVDYAAAGELVDDYHRVAALTADMDDATFKSMGNDARDRLRSEPGVLAKATAVYAKLRASHPRVAAALETSGATANVDFVRLLARHG